MIKFLKKSLQNTFSKYEIDNIFSSFDQIGSIIIIKIPNILESKKKIIGETLLEKIKVTRSVFSQSSITKGEFRIKELELLAGVDKSETEYREYGCRFIVDVKRVFFSPRLSTERNRISNLIKNNEVIMNMFGGIGIFSILAAKHKKCIVYNIDINPDAIKLCKKNIKLNRLIGEVIPIYGDASKILEQRFHDKSDRTLMLLPERSDEFIDSAILTTKTNGIIHYYSHMHSNKKLATSMAIRHYYHITKTKSLILNSNIVRQVGPMYYQTVLDINIKK